MQLEFTNFHFSEVVVWTYHILKIPTGKRGDDKINTKNKLIIAQIFFVLLPFSLCFCCCHIFAFVFLLFYGNLDDFHGSERETQSESSALPCKNLQVCLNEGLLTFMLIF